MASTKLLMAVFAIALILLLAYLMQTLHLFQSAKQLYLSESQKFTTASGIEVNYSASLPIMSSIPFLSSLIPSGGITLSLEKLNGNAKTLVSLGSYAVIAVYMLNGVNQSIVCSQLSSLGTAVSCSSSGPSSFSTLVNASSLTGLNKTLQKVNYSVKLLGTRSVVGRSCDDFLINLNKSQVSQMMGALSGLRNAGGSLGQLGIFNISGISMEECLDQGYGYPARLNISYSTYSQLKNKNNTTVLILVNATAFSQNVKASDFVPPISFIPTNTTCTNSSASFRFISLVNATNTTVVVRNLSTAFFSYNQGQVYSARLVGPKSLSYGGSYSVSFQANLTGGFYFPTLCVASSCQKASSCYVPYSVTTTIPQVQHQPPYINISSIGTGPGGAYRNNDTLSWYGLVSPSATVQLWLINASTGNNILFTPNLKADQFGNVYGVFQTKSNIWPGLVYLKLVDTWTGKSTQASFIKTK